jgi:DNA-binding NtrC family response regulator
MSDTAQTPEAPRPHVLIVDDEDGVRSAIRRTLRTEPYRISEASSALEALETMKSDPPDLVVTDHLMPQMTGLELLRRMRFMHNDVARILLTGQAELETVVAAINDGEVFRFLRKPWDDTELKLSIHMALEQQRTERENRRLLELLRAQADVIRTLERAHPGIATIRRDDNGAIVITEEELAQLGG